MFLPIREPLLVMWCRIDQQDDSVVFVTNDVNLLLAGEHLPVIAPHLYQLTMINYHQPITSQSLPELSNDTPVPSVHFS